MRTPFYCAVIPALAVVCMLGSCEAADVTTVTYAIGETGPGGGIVFYVSDGGLHGMEVSPASTEWTLVEWSGNITTLVGAAGVAVGTGGSNTAVIAAWLTDDGQTGRATQLCRDLNYGGRSDWFLPSSEELQAIWWNLVSDRSADNEGREKPYAGSLGGFGTAYFWTSSETSSWFAYIQYFADGARDYTSKQSTVSVRAVRDF